MASCPGAFAVWSSEFAYRRCCSRMMSCRLARTFKSSLLSDAPHPGALCCDGRELRLMDMVAEARHDMARWPRAPLPPAMSLEVTLLPERLHAAHDLPCCLVCCLFCPYPFPHYRVLKGRCAYIGDRRLWRSVTCRQIKR